MRDHFDSIVIAEMATRQIMDGMRAGTVPGQYAGGIGEPGAEALRDFVTAGGTLVTLGNAAAFAIEQFNLPVTNVVAGLRAEPVFLLGRAVAGRNQGAQSSGGGGSAGGSGGDV